MSTTTELENLVVHLTGDGSSYMQMMRMADEATKRTADVVASVSGQIKGMGESLQGFAQTAMNALSVVGVASTIKGMFQSFADWENSTQRLTTAIGMNGREVGPAIEKYNEFAEAMDKMSMSSVKQTKAMLANAEMQGLAGPRAERAVRDAIALAALYGGDPESKLRATIGMQAGNYMAARRINPSYRGLNDQQLISKYTLDASKGLEAAASQVGTSSNQLTKLGQSLREVSIEVGGLIAKALNPLVRILMTATEAYKSLDEGTKKTIILVLALGLAFLSINPVISAISFVLSLFKVQQILGAAAWMIWNAAALTVSATLGLIKLLLFGNLAAWLATKFIMLTLVPVLYGVALAFNIVTIAMNGAVLAVAGGILYVAFKMMYEVVASLYGVFTSLKDDLGRSWAQTHYLRYISSIFMEWWSILKMVFEVAQYDLPKAWELLTAGANLAVNQMKDLFPPLWNFIRMGFAEVADTVSGVFGIAFDRAKENLKHDLGIALEFRNIEKAIRIAEKEDFNREMDDKLADFTEKSSRKLRVLAKAFGEILNEGVESEETARARIRLENIQKESKNIIDVEGAKRRAMEAGTAIGKSMKDAFKSSKFDAAEMGSAEALTRLADFAEQIRRPIGPDGLPIDVNGVPTTTASGVTVTAEGPGDGFNKVVSAIGNTNEWLEKIHGSLKGGPVLKPAGL